MARKKPDKVKEAFKRLSAEILKYGDEGKGDLRDLFEVHRPEVIFKLEQGPDRQARAAQLIGEMRIISRELSEAKYFRERDDRKKAQAAEKRGKSKAKKKPKKKPVPRRKVSGVHDRFKYVLAELPSGEWAAKITRQGRQILPAPGAPPIIDHPELRKRFRDQGAAELAVRRVINTAMIWYAERGIRPKEKVRRSKSVRAGVQRRTSGQRAAMEREAETEASVKAEEQRRERIRAQRRKEKVEKRDRRPSDPKTSRGRKLIYIPRKNPSKPFQFSHSETGALKQGKKSYDNYKGWMEKWEKSLEDGKPNFRYLMRAYDHIENARANFTIAEDRRLAEEASNLKTDLRGNIVQMFKLCSRELRQRRSNPSSADHKEMASSHMMKADACWKKYCDSCGITDLLNAYKHLELAREEFQHAGDSEGTANACARIKLARKELRKKKDGKAK